MGLDWVAFIACFTASSGPLVLGHSNIPKPSSIMCLSFFFWTNNYVFVLFFDQCQQVLYILFEQFNTKKKKSIWTSCRMGRKEMMISRLEVDQLIWWTCLLHSLISSSSIYILESAKWFKLQKKWQKNATPWTFAL